MERYSAKYFDDAVSDKLPGLLGLRVTKVGSGKMEMELEVGSKHLAINGYLHAGTIVSLADTTAGNGCLVNLPTNAKGFTTIELKCNLIGTLRDGKVRCTSQCIHSGRTTQVWESKVIDSVNDKLIASFTCTQLILYSGG